MSKVLFVNIDSDEIDIDSDESSGDQVARLINEIVAEENITALTPCWNPYGGTKVIGYLVAVDQ